MSKKIKHKSTISPKRRNWLYSIFFIVFAFVLYGNTINNDFAIDDGLVVNYNSDIETGIKDIPEIFVSRYHQSEDSERQSFGYRPFTKSTFAIEYDLFGINPHISHFFNVLLYAFCVIFLFFLLKKLLKNYNVLFPFLISVLFLAHPIHTEAVASIRNREEILSFWGGLVAMYFFVKYVETVKIRNIFLGILFYLIAYLSKESVISFIVAIPLVVYFFTDASLKKILFIFAVLFIVGSIAFFGPLFYLPPLNKEMQFFENPLLFEENIWVRLATSFYSLLIYLKLLVLPHPLGFYYGYSQIPLVNINSILVIISFLIYTFLLVFAIARIKKKSILAFGILFYLATISSVSNILVPINGIVAERLLFAPSLGFCIVISYIMFKIGKFNLVDNFIPVKIRNRLLLLSLVVLIPYTYKTITRNNDWDDTLTLLSHDIKYLENSYGAHHLLAAELLNNASSELTIANSSSGPNQNMEELKKRITNNRKVLSPVIKQYERALEIFPESSFSLSVLGGIYFTFLNENEKALSYFEKAIQVDSTRSEPFISLAYYYDRVQQYNLANKYYNTALEIDPNNIKCLSKLGNLQNRLGDFEEAVQLNEKIMQIDAELDLPYRNISNYYISKRDTANAILYLEKAFEKNQKNEKMCKFLSDYFIKNNIQEKADYYLKKTIQLKRNTN